MEVNFDGLRINGIKAYNNLVRKLNKQIKYKDGITVIDEFYTDRIQRDMDDLRNALVILACIEDESHGIKSIDVEIDEFNSEYRE